MFGQDKYIITTGILTMKLNDLDYKKHAETALRETFEINFDASKLSKIATKEMLSKVSGLIKEAKQSPSFYKDQTKPAYMKLVFMEQALSKHYKNLSLAPATRVVVENEVINENEEVEKSQVILAAQDMVDNVQKMFEDVNDMLVKELPALVDSIQSEIGANESSQFNEQAGSALSELNSALQGARDSLQGALGSITGQEAVGAFDSEEDDLGLDDLGDEDMGLDDLGDEDLGLDDELPSVDDLDEPEDESTGSVGREKR